LYVDWLHDRLQTRFLNSLQAVEFSLA